MAIVSITFTLHIIIVRKMRYCATHNSETVTYLTQYTSSFKRKSNLRRSSSRLDVIRRILEFGWSGFILWSYYLERWHDRELSWRIISVNTSVRTYVRSAVIVFVRGQDMEEQAHKLTMVISWTVVRHTHVSR